MKLTQIHALHPEIRLVNQASIGQQIRKIRQMRDLSQENVAEELGISKGALSKIESGATNVPLSRLIQIAEVLKVDIRDFFPPRSIGKMEDPNKQYGYASKSDVEELQKKMEVLNKEMQVLKSMVETLDLKSKSKTK